MTLTLEFLPAAVVSFGLIFARLAAMIMLFPVFSHGALSLQIRLMLALMLTFAFYGLLKDYYVTQSLGLMAMIGRLIWEIVIGLFFGGTVRLVFFSVQVAGNFVAQASNLAALPGFDLMSGEQTTPLGVFFSLTVIVLLFALNLHHLLIAGLFSTYKALPPGLVFPIGDFANLALSVVRDSFAAAMKLAAPFIVLGIVTQAGLGILSRLMPQLQVFFVAMPVNMLLGMTLLFFLFAVMMTWYSDHFAAQVSLVLGL